MTDFQKGDFSMKYKNESFFCIPMDQQGQALTEYITLLVLVALVAVGAAQTLGRTVKSKIQTARDHINSDINFESVRSR
jgi:Flp pilus assembly pilin Flp